jgi:hypothetical protein
MCIKYLEYSDYLEYLEAKVKIQIIRIIAQWLIISEFYCTFERGHLQAQERQVIKSVLIGKSKGRLFGKLALLKQPIGKL